jgi:hypothetical protein
MRVSSQAVGPHLGGLEEGVGVDLGGAQRGGGVGCEERVAGARAKDDDAAVFQVADGAAADVWLRDLARAEVGGGGRAEGPSG